MVWNLSSTESIRSEKAKIGKSSDGIRKFVILSLKRKNKIGQKRQMSLKIFNKFYTGGLQKFDQYTKLNAIDKSIDNNEIVYLLARYKKHKYRFITTSLLTLYFAMS